MSRALRNDRDIVEKFEEQRKRPGLAKSALLNLFYGLFRDPAVGSLRDAQHLGFMRKKEMHFAQEERRRKRVETAIRLLGVREHAPESIFSNDVASTGLRSAQRREIDAGMATERITVNELLDDLVSDFGCVTIFL